MKKLNIKFKSLLIIFLIAVCLLASLFTYNVTYRAPRLEVHVNNGIVSLITGDFNSPRVKNDSDVLNILDRLKDTYGYENAGDELVLSKTLDTAGGKVYRFDQKKNGLTVFGRGLNVSVDHKGEILSVSGNYLKGITIRPVPEISGEDAAGIIVDTYTEVQINSINLEIYSINDSCPALAYDAVAVIDGVLTRIFVSADTGAVIEEIPVESNHMPPAYNTTIVKNTTQKDYYGENKSVDIEKQGVYYYLNDAYRNIILYDCDNTDQPKNYYYSTSRVFNDGLAVTALLNTVKAFDYYTDAGNIGVSFSGVDNSVDGTHRNKEAFIMVCLHYDEQLQNAFCSFDPDYVDDTYGRSMYLIFGDGHPSGLYNLAVGADVVGHEYQHAVTGYTAGLVYLNASGALNEAYSDIFGALIENHDQTDDNFWITGEDATADKKGMRSMINPVDYGYPDHLDNMYPMDGNYDQGGVHYNSSIITHAQYKMYTEMPSHFTKQNIGKLWYTALTMLSPDSDFSDFKIIMRQAGAQLGWSDSVLDVMDVAFESCGIKGTGGEHTITFDKGGMEGSAPLDITCDYGESFIIPDCGLTAPYARLAGWSETGNYKSAVYFVGETYEMPPFDLTLYPVLEREIWNGVEPVALSGQGTQDSPYLIPTAEALATVAYYFNNDVEKPWAAGLRPWFLMTADIDLKNIPWIPIGHATAAPGEAEPEPAADRINFDGGGHVIRNLKISYEDPDKFIFQGFFGAIADIDIMRLGIESGSIETAAMYVGAIAGGMRDGSITDCFSKINVTNSASIIYYGDGMTYGSAGGIAGYIKGDGSRITRCHNSGDISAHYTGGICAVQYDKVAFADCCNTGSVTGMMMGGGIAGFSSYLNAVNCINTGAITGRSSYIGGICGALYAADRSVSSIIGCKNTGELSGWFRGGLIGSISRRCSILLEKNHYKDQDGVLYIGNIEDVKDRISLSGDEPVYSGDEMWEGDFAFGDINYFSDSEYFSDISEESAAFLYYSLRSTRIFTVTWDIDGVLETEEYKYEQVPQYKGTPVKTGNAQYSYIFTGWSPSFAAVSGNITYTAQFVQTLNNYTVTFMSEGQIIDTQNAAYGTKPADLLRPAKKGYTFKGWYKDEECVTAFDKDIDIISSDITLYAKWEKKACGCGSIDLSSGMIIFLLLMFVTAVYFLKPRRIKNY